MGFVVGLLLGVVVGVGLVMVFVRWENARSKSRGQLVLLVPPPLALVRCLVCFYVLPWNCRCVLASALFP